MQAEALGDKRIVVAIDSWEADSAYPAGHYVRTLGTIGDRETETEVRPAYCSPECCQACQRSSKRPECADDALARSAAGALNLLQVRVRAVAACRIRLPECGRC